MPSEISAVDVFAGCGGSASGLKMAGVNVLVSINHNPIAIHSHALNHPDTIHYRDDAFQFDPRTCPPAHILAMSPECRRHSIAATRNTDNKNQLSLWSDELPDTVKSRATMTMVPKFARLMNPQPLVVIVENVVHVEKWPEFHLWKQEMLDLGYRCQILCLNAAHFGVPQKRDRLFAVFTHRDLPEPDLTPSPIGFCEHCNTKVHTLQHWKKEGVYIGTWPRQYVYKCIQCNHTVTPDMIPASTVIDWSLPTMTIRERNSLNRTYAANTIARIERGLKHPKNQDGPFIASYYTGSDVFAPVSQPLPTITTKDHFLLVIPDETRTLENCRTRMLHPKELKEAAGFDKTYFLAGGHTQQVKQIGNAVAPPVMRWIAERITRILN